MSLFLRLLGDEDKGAALEAAIRSVVAGELDGRVFVVEPDSFEQVPGAPFAYWVSEATRRVFQALPAFSRRQIRAPRAFDVRRLSLSPSLVRGTGRTRAWVGTVVRFLEGRGVFTVLLGDSSVGGVGAEAADIFWFFRTTRTADRKAGIAGLFLPSPGLTWPRRTTSGLALRAMPAGCIFADKGPAAFVSGDDPQALLALLALSNASPFGMLVSLQLAAADAAARSYEVGVIQRTPVPASRNPTLIDLPR